MTIADMIATRLLASSPSPDSEGVEQSVQGFDAGQLIPAGIVLGVGIVVAVAAKMLIHRIVRRHNEIIGRLAGRSAAAVVIAVSLVYSLSTLGIRVGLLLGALGVAGFALAFALQDILSNLIAGIILQIRQPFTYDDYVSIEDYEGTVTDISLRAVEMKLFSGEAVIIPSATVLQNPIENWTRLDKRRLEIEVGVDYGVDLDRAADVIRDGVTGVDGSLDEPAPMVVFDGFGASSVDLKVYVWIPSDGDYFGTRLRAASAIKRSLEDAGIDIPYPIRTLLDPDGRALGSSDGRHHTNGDEPASERRRGRDRQGDAHDNGDAEAEMGSEAHAGAE